MQIRSLIAVFLCSAIVSGTVFAQEGKDRREAMKEKGKEMMRRGAEGGGPGMSPGAMMANLPIVMALDTDKDGTLSVSEIANASKALLTLDKNGDGIVSGEEMRPAFPMAGGPRPGDTPPGGGELARMFTTQDANNDGKLTGDEIPERMRERVASIDENGDGAIDRNEMQKMMARMGGGGRPGDRPGQGGKDGSGVRPKRPDQGANK